MAKAKDCVYTCEKCNKVIIGGNTFRESGWFVIAGSTKYVNRITTNSQIIIGSIFIYFCSMRCMVSWLIECLEKQDIESIAETIKQLNKGDK